MSRSKRGPVRGSRLKKRERKDMLSRLDRIVDGQNIALGATWLIAEVQEESEITKDKVLVVRRNLTQRLLFAAEVRGRAELDDGTKPSKDGYIEAISCSNRRLQKVKGVIRSTSRWGVTPGDNALRVEQQNQHKEMLRNIVPESVLILPGAIFGLRALEDRIRLREFNTLENTDRPHYFSLAHATADGIGQLIQFSRPSSPE